MTEFKADIGAGVSIITLGTIGLLVANFIKSYKNNEDISIFNISTFCLILSGIFIIYNDSIIKRPAYLKRFSSFGKLEKAFNIIGNTLFDFGIILLLFGVGILFISQLETASFIKNNFIILILLLIIFFIINYRYRRDFEN